LGLYDIYVFMKNLFIRIKCNFLLITHLIKLRWNPPRCVKTNVMPDLSYLSLWRLMTTNEVGFTDKSTMTDPRIEFTHFLGRFSSNPSTKSTRTISIYVDFLSSSGVQSCTVENNYPSVLARVDHCPWLCKVDNVVFTWAKSAIACCTPVMADLIKSVGEFHL
jgi:hypothetical protein